MYSLTVYVYIPSHTWIIFFMTDAGGGEKFKVLEYSK